MPAIPGRPAASILPILILALLVAVAWGVWTVAFAAPAPAGSGEGTPSTRAGASTPGDAATPAAGAATRTAVPDAVQDAARPSRLRHADGRPAAGIRYWLWGARRPLWARSFAEPKLLRTVPVLADPAGRTGADGAFTLPAGAHAAISFAVFDYHVFTFAVGEADLECVLPEFTTVGLRLHDAAATDDWLVELNPYVRGQGIVRTAGPAARRHVQAMFTHRFPARGSAVCEIPVLAGWEHQLLPSSRAYEIRPFFNRLVGPAVVDVRPAERRVPYEIQVVDAADQPVAVDSAYSLRLDAGGADRGKITAGVARGYISPGAKGTLHVFLAGAEHVQQAVAVTAAGPNAFRVVRGSGPQPLRIALPEGFGKVRAVLFENARGRFSFGLGLDRDPDGLVVMPVFTRHGDALFVTNLPAGWRELFVVDETGRFARAFPLDGAMRLVAQWLPDRPLRLDLGAERVARGSPDAGHFQLAYTLTSSTGQRRRFRLFTYRFEGGTRAFPTWHKHLPHGMQSQLLLERRPLLGLDGGPASEGAPVARKKGK